MTSTYNTVSVGGTEFDVYADVATIDAYMAGEASAYGTAWRALSDDTVKARNALTATRTLDRQRWPGTKTDEDQVLEFPRDGMGSDCADDGIIPQRLIDAACLIAGMIQAGVDVTGTASVQSQVKRQAAGSVSIEYFRPSNPIARFPLPVQELLACLFAGASSSTIAGSVSYGTDDCSDFSNGYEPSGGL